MRISEVQPNQILQSNVHGEVLVVGKVGREVDVLKWSFDGTRQIPVRVTPGSLNWR